MHNSTVHEKSTENLRKIRNTVFCSADKRAKTLVASLTFKSFKIFNENLSTVERLKNSMLMNRSIYVEVAILELSKLLMYDFPYNFIRKRAQDNTLLFTDTDSLNYPISTQNVFEDMKLYASLFHLSDCH